jgi:hypothetical protein
MTGTYDIHVRKKECAQNPKESILHRFKIVGMVSESLLGESATFGTFRASIPFVHKMPVSLSLFPLFIYKKEMGMLTVICRVCIFTSSVFFHSLHELKKIFSKTPREFFNIRERIFGPRCRRKTKWRTHTSAQH